MAQVRTTLKMRTGILFVLTPPDEMDNEWQVTVVNRGTWGLSEERVIDSYDIPAPRDEESIRQEIIPRLYNTVPSTTVDEYKREIEELIREQVAAVQANQQLSKT